MMVPKQDYSKCPNCGGRLWMDDESIKKFFTPDEDITARQFLAAATFWCAGCGRMGAYEELRTGEPGIQDVAWEGELVPIEEEWVRLDELQAGAIFETQDGARAVKSEYRHSFVACKATGKPVCLCILLGSGEYGFFKDGNATMVREIAIGREDEG